MHSGCNKKDRVCASQIALKRDASPDSLPEMGLPVTNVFAPLTSVEEGEFVPDIDPSPDPGSDTMIFLISIPVFWHVKWKILTVQSLVKLDRALANSAWFLRYPSTSANYMAPGISDHSPVVVTVFDDPPIKPRFSFLNCWIDHPQYKDIVKGAWDLPVAGSIPYKLFAKLKNVKNALTPLHRAHFNGIADKVKALRDKLHCCQLDLQTNPLSPSLISAEKELLQQYCKFKNIEKNILKQKERKQQQILGHIKDRFGQERVGLNEVAAGFLDYYKSLLGSQQDILPLDDAFIQRSPCVQSTDMANLIRPVEVDEIKVALFDTGSDKTPGPDGFSSAFFKNSWDLVAKDFCKTVNSFFTTGRMSKQANTTLIALIPKKKVFDSVLDFRPISCCTTFYKTVSKILSKRLQALLPVLIGPKQATFVQGRNIYENIMLSQSLVKEYSRKYLTPRCLIKVEIRRLLTLCNDGSLRTC
ncbi:uncharacterized protein LOC141649142 [Silene latifolia]|uniref:uncharacterized protein LOC141649142 n=1 Tax=Silene latifolia TaxID=37657 RepID=UPI003D774696